MGAGRSDREYSEVWRGYDPVFFDLARSSLEGEGIPVRTRVTRVPELHGIGPYATMASVDVPEEDADRAEALLRDLAAARIVEDAPPNSAEAGSEQRDRGTASILAVLCPGLGQIFMLRGYAGLCILLGHIFTIAVAVLWRSIPQFALTMIAAAAVDVVGVQLSAIALERGERMSRGRQLRLGFLEIAVIQTIAGIAAILLSFSP